MALMNVGKVGYNDLIVGFLSKEQRIVTNEPIFFDITFAIFDLKVGIGHFSAFPNALLASLNHLVDINPLICVFFAVL